MGGLQTLIHVCRLTFPRNTAFLRVHLGSSLLPLPPPPSSQPPGAAFPLSKSHISPSPLPLPSCRPLIAAEARPAPLKPFSSISRQRERRVAARSDLMWPTQSFQQWPYFFLCSYEDPSLHSCTNSLFYFICLLLVV